LPRLHGSLLFLELLLREVGICNPSFALVQGSVEEL
jgi:hypothetical protein